MMANWICGYTSGNLTKSKEFSYLVQTQILKYAHVSGIVVHTSNHGTLEAEVGGW
jgi:hypothetical protein